jgi:hypothetical protein
VIEEIRDCVASRLWHLVLVKAKLQEDLKALKSYFLLSKGEFFHTFLEEARDMMTLAPKSTAEFDLNNGPLQ